MAENIQGESESGKLTQLERRLRRVKRLKRLLARVQNRLEEEVKALEEFVREHLQSFGRSMASCVRS